MAHHNLARFQRESFWTSTIKISPAGVEINLLSSADNPVMFQDVEAGRVLNFRPRTKGTWCSSCWGSVFETWLLLSTEAGSGDLLPFQKSISIKGKKKGFQGTKTKTWNPTANRWEDLLRKPYEPLKAWLEIKQALILSINFSPFGNANIIPLPDPIFASFPLPTHGILGAPKCLVHDGSIHDLVWLNTTERVTKNSCPLLRFTMICYLDSVSIYKRMAGCSWDLQRTLRLFLCFPREENPVDKN